MIFNNSKFNHHWPTKTLNELGSFNRGKSKHRPRNDKRLFENGNFPLIQTGNVRQANLFIDSHSANYNDFGLAQSRLWPKNTLCITIAANIAETAMLGYEMCFPDSIVGFNAFPDECSEVFMHYIFTYIRSSIQNSVQGSIQDNINIEYLTNLKFKIPNRNERKQIEKLLYSLDAKIEVNKKINADLEAMAKLIYDYWFVQFDFPDAKGKPYKSSGGKIVYNEALKREIPEDWDDGSLVDIANFVNGIACQKYRPDSDEFLPVIKIREMRDGFTSNTEKVKADIPDKVKVFDGDILFSWSASLVVMQWSGGEGGLNQHIFKVTSNKYPKSYFYFELLNYLEHFKMVAELRKTTMGHITRDHLKQSKIVIPPLEITQQLDEKLKPILDKQVLLQKQNQKLAELRDWLLPMLMNGQVTIGGEILNQVQDDRLGMVAEDNAKYGEV